VIVLGLTGSIGMGKTTAAKMLRGLGLPLFDADLVVHRLLARGGAAVARVEAAFPGVLAADGGIDRAILGRRVFGDSAALWRLEQMLHPLVRIEERRFLARARTQRRPIAVLDIPLLFETGGERRCDHVLVVSAPEFLQRQRVLRRAGMSEERLAAILAKQMPDREKRRRADFVVQTGLGRNLTLRRLDAIVRLLRADGGRKKTGERRRGR
jgi:dephospho-CoA kinase